eukprot:CAMPEP_0197047190 /NCGR_PEP_ID=MMETSP1384-20130603/22716_1 /TAXON_ID=29189 /ORGANISM="Ammonia sp." /LENGTH=186 /DNA_ID=CAMNT_0042479071 /DNA_START=86 /DNA_END=646 /DNA_ORIENTATION=-
MALEVDPQIAQKWDEICEKNSKINFYIAEFVRKPKKALTFWRDGNGGIDELKAILKENQDKALFGILIVKFYDDNNSEYRKFVWFKYVPTKVPVMTKGQLTPQLGHVENAFPVKHLTYIIDEELDKFDMEHISKDFDRVTENLVEIEYFEYGPNQTYKWAKKVKKPNMNNKKEQQEQKDNDQEEEY